MTMKTLQGWIPFLLLLVLASPTPVQAYVSGSVSAPSGGYDLELGVGFTRGLLGAQDIPESQQTTPASITEYRLRAGHNFGKLAGMEDATLRVSGTYCLSQPEWQGGTELYPGDSGWILGLEASANFLHETARAVGAFARFSLPSGMIVEKFEKPRIDLFALGLQAAFELSDVVAVETLVFYGSGLLRGGTRHQNAALVGSEMVSARWNGVLLRGLALKAGPFFESDITERSDARYGTVGFRGFRVGIIAIGAVRVTDSVGLELGYVQKLSGAFFTATKDLFITTRIAFD